MESHFQPSTTSQTETSEKQTGDEETQGHPKQAECLKSWKLGILMFSLCLWSLLVPLNSAIIDVITHDLNTSFKSLLNHPWHAFGYTLGFTTSVLTLRSLYQLFNVRVIFGSCVIIFELGSIICAAAPNSTIVVLGYAILGLGAAGITLGWYTIILLIVELERQPFCLGLLTSASVLPYFVMPIMGEPFVKSVSWRVGFLINLPIGGIPSVILIFFLKNCSIQNELRSLPFKAKLAKLDALGTILFAGAFCCLALAIEWGNMRMPWESATIIGLFIGFGLLSIAFIIVQYLRGDDALIPRRIFLQRSVWSGLLFIFFTSMMDLVYSIFLPSYFENVQGVNSTVGALCMMPFYAAEVVLAVLTGAAITKWGYYMPYIIAGMLLSVFGAGLLTRIDTTTQTAEWATLLVIIGIGVGMALPLPYTVVQIFLSEKDAMTAIALFLVFQIFGEITCSPIALFLFRTNLESKLSTLIPTGSLSVNRVARESPHLIPLVREIYADSIMRTYILALGSLCVATLCVPFMEWKNVKTEAELRRKRSGNEEGFVENIK